VTPHKPNVRRLLVGVLILAFVVRAAAMVMLRSWEFPTERDFGFEEGEIAFALANGQGYSWPSTWRPVGPPGEVVKRDHPIPTTWKAPVYPVLIAATFLVFGSFSTQAAIALELFQILLAILTCVMLFRLGKLLFDEDVGLLAALIFAVYPASIHFSVQKIEYAPLLTLLGLVLVERTIEFSKRPGITGGLILGILSGIALLVNPVILAFYPFALLWLLWKCRSGWRDRFVYGGTIVACCVAVLTPWLVRNYLVFDRFVFIRPNFSRELVLANYSVNERGLASDNSAAVGGNDGRLSDLYQQKAWNLIVEKPANLARGVIARAPVFWTHMGENKGAVGVVAGIAYLSVLGFGLAGIWFSRRREQIQLPIIFLLTMPLPFYLTWAVRGRFRFPLEPILILFASYALVALVSRFWPRRNAQAGHHQG
jgi:4-amino-4-deoxy-L-arabinose transferase-like glycosyltransferase